MKHAIQYNKSKEETQKVPQCILTGHLTRSSSYSLIHIYKLYIKHIFEEVYFTINERS